MSKKQRVRPFSGIYPKDSSSLILGRGVRASETQLEIRDPSISSEWRRVTLLIHLMGVWVETLNAGTF